LLGEVIENLLDNAAKYSHPGSTIEVRTFKRDSLAVLEVENHAPLIEATQLDQLFGRFVRSNHQQEGSGLGLSIVKEIVEILGGQASISQDSTLGTICARCTFPLVEIV